MAALAIPCPVPFLAESAYPYTAGLRSGRFCGPFAPGVSCCLPCPLEGLVYSDAFERNTKIAYWFNVPALLCQVFLLASFAVLKERHSHAHYLSVGLCISLAMLELSFIIPLVLLRSLWTHLRVCADVRHTSTLFWIAQGLGWGLPALFLAISLPITGVSYQVGTTCFPNQHSAFITWFGWLLAFACLAALIQFLTTGFCLWLYLRHFLHLSSSSSGDSADSNGPETNVAALMPDAQHKPRRASIWLGKKLAWRRVRKVLSLQWRSIVLSLFVITEIIYFGVVFVAETRAARANNTPAKTAKIEAWAACLVLSGGNKTECLQYASAFGLSEGLVLATFFMSALIGTFTFALLARWSMFVGWLELVSHPEDYWRKGRVESFILVTPKGKRGGKGVMHGHHADGMVQPKGGSVGMTDVPEAGDVTTRHETTDWFDGEEDLPKRTRVREELDEI
ncbi:hypothetical protein B0A55_02235 [Friedmanniomyces simplex]|uniref:G-protein coupled receptors family 2 profile 2 domain-containing protein n=1 Tax=Friedmanniomyces simplex TaxID=329884 RepID=A0A4U0XTP0_9PEZI|nr:hypothetical protein B0A55_02235 [Friedmanniomyces simplex]